MVGYGLAVNNSVNGVGYFGFFNPNTRVGFAVAQSPMGMSGEAVDFHCNVRTNTKNENTIVGIRFASSQTDVAVTVPST